MGIRSMNYLALQPGIVVPPQVWEYIGEGLQNSDNRGTLFIFETNISPLWARDGKGENCARDLEEEVAIHRFLGSLMADSFYLVRVGAEYGVRGAWEDHAFLLDDSVKEINEAYRDATASTDE